jgi:hypothetical protein
MWLRLSCANQAQRDHHPVREFIKEANFGEGASKKAPTGAKRKEYYMSSANQTMQDLARRARQGDALALAELREDLRPQMVRIVRRALRSETDNPPLVQGIRATADQVRCSAKNRAAKDSDGLIGQIARRHCDLLARKLQGDAFAGRTLRETMRNE